MWALLLGVLLVLAATPVSAQMVGIDVSTTHPANDGKCIPVTVLPIVITEPGVHCFTGDLATAMTTGSAIDVRADNVTVDLKGFTLDGVAAGLGTLAHGVTATNRHRLTIRSGTIRGFFRGTLIEDENAVHPGGRSTRGTRELAGPQPNHVIEDIRADQNTFVAIEVWGAGSVIRDNQVMATGGSTVFGASHANAYGMSVSGVGVLVLNNDVVRTVSQGTGIAVGLYFYLGDVQATGNRIVGADRGIEYGYGGATGSYRSNLTFDVTAPFTGGTDAGNNQEN